MKYLTGLVVILSFCLSISGQTGKVSFAGKLSGKEKQDLYIYNDDEVDISVPLRDNNTFSLVKNNLQLGFYETGPLGTVYFGRGYKLNVQPGEDMEYVFTGAGSLENNALRTAKAQLAAFIPIGKKGEMAQEAYYLELPVFLQKLDSFQHNGERIFNKSTDTFFCRYAALDLKFYAKDLLFNYSLYYGKDLKKDAEARDMVSKLDRTEPYFFGKMDSLLRTSTVKVISQGSIEKLIRLMYQDWDKNDEVLFRNSSWYRKAYTAFLEHRSVSPKFMTSLSKGYKREDNDITLLAVATEECKNAPDILSYFKYRYTRSILQEAKDTATLNKYYQDYLTRASRQDYLLTIKQIYHNATTYRDSMQAPGFSYKDVSGKTVSLESLRGKYIYIDLWATWCTPCKAEIPHLKKTEEANKDKNIQFVSISLDERKDYQNWKEYVNNNDLQGIQLVADSAFESDFAIKMGILSIPRFILIDPSGKIISANALRPSDKALQTLLNKLTL